MRGVLYDIRCLPRAISTLLREIARGKSQTFARKLEILNHAPTTYIVVGGKINYTRFVEHRSASVRVFGFIYLSLLHSAGLVFGKSIFCAFVAKKRCGCLVYSTKIKSLSHSTFYP